MPLFDNCFGNNESQYGKPREEKSQSRNCGLFSIFSFWSCGLIARKQPNEDDLLAVEINQKTSNDGVDDGVTGEEQGDLVQRLLLNE